MLTFGVNHKDLVVGDNTTARVYATSEIKNIVKIKKI